uniref:Uncharacterized protein n=4 Tax=Meloidogyne enterolobii TaxID=390850 RepID=A0A6V7VKI5_MELEN|nr:unnamed protein product [Meloidogyne enterolobii]CAD2175486.1 unnamed protein product [Meloidogyne enterolobii]CAD2185590.1 unnamed protein product [Meloidogyne enterolobii]CAD2190888.1 unnamed protein product [Meloidogyne enterolobii]CAD2200484.1 unnamed protein product [Meloidogyne enterolobii]
MANKFILVPEEIYKGLTTFDTGEPNLDLIRNDLEKIKRKKDTPSAKNVKYNQELRRYLQMRNEQQNRPVKVEMVATPKGAIMSTNSTRPTSNIVEDDDEILTTDEISLPSFPQSNKDVKSIIDFKPQKLPHPPSLSSSTSVKKRFKKLRGSSPPPPPLPPTTNLKIIKKEIVSVPKKRFSRPKSTKYSKTGSTKQDSRKQDSIILSEDVPIISTHVSPQQRIIKRELEEDDFEGIKRKKIYDNRREKEIRQKENKLKEIDKKRYEKRQQLLARRRKSQKLKVPIDPYVIQQLRNEEKIGTSKGSRRVLREGRSPSPPLSRQKIKRKAEWSQGDGHTIAKVQRKVNKKQSQRASRLWVKNLKKRNLEFRSYKTKNKWATRKPTQKDINRFKPSLW